MIIWATSTWIGFLISKKYANRVQELKEIKNGLNILETKIKFTYEPLPEIFGQITNTLSESIGRIFEMANIKMKAMPIEEAWKYAVENSRLNLNKEDLKIIENLGKLLR